MGVKLARRRAVSVTRLRPRATPPPQVGVGPPAAAVAVLVAGLFAPRLAELVRAWLTDPDLSHGFLIPPVCGWLVWRAVRRGGPPRRGEWGGLAWIAAGCLLRFAAEIVWFPPVDYAALVAVLHGLAVQAGGRVWARGLWAPTLLLGFMFPLPGLLADQLALRLQGVVAGLAATVLGLFLPAYRVGYTLYLPGQELQVGAACSGLRQVVVFVAIAAVLACIGRRSRAFRVFLVLSSFFVAVAANVLRVVLVALVQRNLGDALVRGVWHDVWGVVAMAGGVGLLLAIRAWLNRLLPEGPEEGGWEESDRVTRVVRPVPGLSPPSGLGLAALCLGLALAARLALSAHLASGPAPRVPGLREPLTSVPVSGGAWIGQDLPPTTLPTFVADYYHAAADRVFRTYRLATGGGEDAAAPVSCQLCAVYYRDGSDRQHHPVACARAAGLDLQGVQAVDIPGGPRVARYEFRGDGGKQYVYHWFYTFEQFLDEDPSPLRRLHRRLTQHPPSVTAEVITAADTPAGLSHVEGLIGRAERALRDCLPPGTRAGSDVPPGRVELAASR